MPKPPLSIVPVDKIPKGEEVPLDDLLDIFRHAVFMQNLCLQLDGIGLSAVQVGIPWNLFVVNDEKEGGIFLNCSYEGIGEKDQDSIEGCLSLKSPSGKLRRFSVKRYKTVRVRGKKLLVQRGDPQFVLQEIDKEYDGLFSVVFQHEIDHANQILISDFGTEIHIW
jgi:peptide deformylase